MIVTFSNQCRPSKVSQKEEHDILLFCRLLSSGHLEVFFISFAFHIGVYTATTSFHSVGVQFFPLQIFPHSLHVSSVVYVKTVLLLTVVMSRRRKIV